MALPVPAGVECSYNRIIFPSNIKTKVEEEPIESGDGRVIKFSKLTISITGYITRDESGNVPLDALMRTWRTSLQKNCKNLVYVNKGFGIDLNINPLGGGGVRDVAMGPKAGKFTWEPLGGAPTGCFAAKFQFSVTACIPECTTARYVPGDHVFTDISFTVAFANDEAGLVTITTSGTFSIPLTLQSNNTLTDSVDGYLLEVVKPPPDGFIRTANRQLSADRRTCTFTLTDKQLEVAYLEDVVVMDAEHRVRDMGGIMGTAIKWDCTYSGTVRMSPTAPRSLAWARFWAIVFDRIDLTRNTPGLKPSGDPSGENCSVTWPLLEFSETIFKNQSRFSVRYKILKGATLQNIFSASGLWRPIGTNFNVWSTSLANNAQQTGGLIGAGFLPADDVIVDVCGGDVASMVGGIAEEVDPDLIAVDAAGELVEITNSYEPITLMGDIDVAGAADEAGGTTIVGPSSLESPGKGSSQVVPSGVTPPQPGNSWLYWQCSVTRLVDYKMIRHKPLSGDAATETPQVDALGPVEPVAGDTAPPSFGFTSTVPDVIQQVASPSITLRLTGTAMRLLFRINAPKLLTVGGVTATLAREEVTETELASPGGLNLYRTDWTLDYLLPSAPSSVPIPANPFLDVDGQT